MSPNDDLSGRDTTPLLAGAPANDQPTSAPEHVRPAAAGTYEADDADIPF